MSLWVASAILQRELVKDRRKLLSKFIDVAWQCKEASNFNGVFEILSGLANSAVHRLKKTWEQLSQHRWDWVCGWGNWSNFLCAG